MSKKSNNVSGHLLKGFLAALGQGDSRWHRLRWSEARPPAALMVPPVPGTATWLRPAERPLDTNLSPANKSQTDQPECYFWQPALLFYKRQTCSWAQRTTKANYFCD